MTLHTFETPQAARIYVELERGLIEIHATDGTQTRVEAHGNGSEQVVVEQDDRQISVVGPQGRDHFFSRSPGDIVLRITVPSDSDLMVRSGSADLDARGDLGELRVRTGSGDIAVERLRTGMFETGSGDLVLQYVAEDAQIKSGSGDVSVRQAGGDIAISTGSGDVLLDDVRGRTAVKSGSGDVSVRTASRGELDLTSASGDVALAIPAGTPVWSDLSTVTGDVSSHLDPVGAPQEGQDHVRVHARTVSGDITLNTRH